MARIVKVKCFRCRKEARNDGTEENPKWVCQNPKCVRYTPPKDEEAKSAGENSETQSND